MKKDSNSFKPDRDCDCCAIWRCKMAVFGNTNPAGGRLHIIKTSLVEIHLGETFQSALRGIPWGFSLLLAKHDYNNSNKFFKYDWASSHTYNWILFWIFRPQNFSCSGRTLRKSCTCMAAFRDQILGCL